MPSYSSLFCAGQLTSSHPAQKYQRICKVWINGIYWKYKEVEVVVEMSELNRCITVLLSEKDTERALQMCSSVLNEVRCLQAQLCPCESKEYIITPSQLASVRTTPVSGRCLIPLSFVAKALVKRKEVAYDELKQNKVDIKKIVSNCEPFSCLLPVVIKELLDVNTLTLSRPHLLHLQSACHVVLKKLPSQDSDNVQLLRKRINQFSIFTGLNPLVS